jgi:hypothetical protein
MLAEGDDVESSNLIISSILDAGLEKTVRIGGERLCRLLRRGVSTNAVDDVDLGQVATVGEQVHARHSSGPDVADDADSNHCLADLIADHAEEVQRGGGGGIRTQSKSANDQRRVDLARAHSLEESNCVGRYREME